MLRRLIEEISEMWFRYRAVKRLNKEGADFIKRQQERGKSPLPNRPWGSPRE